MSENSTHVCVCVFVYYTPFSSVARGVPYLLQGMYGLSRHHLTILKSPRGHPVGIKEKVFVTSKEGFFWSATYCG